MPEESPEATDVERIDAMAEDLNEEMAEVLEHQAEGPEGSGAP